MFCRVFLSIFLVGIFFSSTTLATEYYVDAHWGADSSSGTNWASAKQSIQSAIDETNAGDLIWVTNGTYSAGGTTNGVLDIVRNITVQSVNGPDVTIVDGSNGVRCAYMTDGILAGFTLANGYSSGNGGGAYLFEDGTLKNCMLTGNAATNDGGGVYLDAGGTLSNCTLSGNTARNGGGVYVLEKGTLNNCTLSGNATSIYGGGAYLYYGGTLNNCTLSGNSADSGGGGGTYLSGGGTLNNCTLSLNSANYGGGAFLDFGSALNNCTLSGNTATYGGGTYLFGGTLNNCIVWENSASSLNDNIYKSDGIVQYTCAQDGIVPGANGCFISDPFFAGNGDYSLRSDSPCINAGSNELATTGTDQTGNPRIAFATVDVGAYEWQGELDVESGPAVGGNAITIHLDNSAGSITSVTVGGVSATITGQTVDSVTIIIPAGLAPGLQDVVVDGIITFVDAYTVNLAGSIDGLTPASAPWAGGATITISGSNLCSGVSGDVIGVSLCGANVRSILSISSTQLVVTAAAGPPGTGDVVVESINYGITAAANAFAYVKEDQLILFPTIENQWTTNVVALSALGGGSSNAVSFSVASGPAVINGADLTFTRAGTVVVTADQAGSTFYNAAPTVTNRFLVSPVPGLTTYVDVNNGSDSHSGFGWASAKQSIQAAVDLVGDGGAVWVTNGIYSTGGTTNGVLDIACHITVQSVNGSDVTIIDGTNGVRCVYMTNGTLFGFSLTNGYSVTDGGGAYLDGGGVLKNCALIGNSAINEGGGAYLEMGGSLNNCMLSGNTADTGGGAYLEMGGMLNNCTVSGNSTISGAGVHLNDGGTLNNCIVWGNGWKDIEDYRGAVHYTCASNGIIGGVSGCITQNPLFVDAAKGDFNLQFGSPCINAGDNNAAPVGTDLAGNPRIEFSTVDMGAYECLIPPVSVPEALSAVDITDSQFTARWQETADATNYVIDVSESINFTSMTGSYSNWSAGNVTACLVTGLSDHVTYWYRVRAANPYGSSFDSNVIEVPVSTNTPYVLYEITNGVGSAGSTDVIDLTEMFHGSGMLYTVVSNSNPQFVTAGISGTELLLDYAPNVNGRADITVRVTDEYGFWVETVITIQIVDEPGTAVGELEFNLQNGLYEQRITVTNESALLKAQSITLTMTDMIDGVTIYNATGVDSEGNPTIQWNGMLAPLDTASFTVQYYTPYRGTVPSATVTASLSLEDIPSAISGRVFNLNGRAEALEGAQAFLVEFDAVPGRTYFIQYSSDLSNWKTVYPGIIAPVDRIQWIDSGPPATECLPGDATNRFYRVLEAAE